MVKSTLNEREIHATEHDDTSEGKKVLLVDSSGTPYSAGGSATPYDVIIDEATTSSVTYIGKAVIGTATSAASWQIKRIDETVTDVVTIEWADNDADFDNVWDNRGSLSYG